MSLLEKRIITEAHEVAELQLETAIDKFKTSIHSLTNNDEGSMRYVESLLDGFKNVVLPAAQQAAQDRAIEDLYHKVKNLSCF